MAKKFYSVNCHYDMVITVDVIAESDDEAIELAKQNADFASIDKWAECYGSSECIADEQELTDELQEKADEQQAMFDKKQEHGKQIELDYDAGDTVTWHCDEDGQDHTSTITGISIEVNSEGEAEVTYKTEIEFKGCKQDAYFSEYDIVNK